MAIKHCTFMHLKTLHLLIICELKLQQNQSALKKMFRKRLHLAFTAET